MSEGWVRLHRKLLESQVFMNSDLLKVWIYCLLKAVHKETWVPVKTGAGTTEVKLMPGQLIFGRFKASKELRMKPSSVRNRMEKLKNTQNVDTQADTHFSIITICNWNDYQVNIKEDGHLSGQPQDNHRTTTGQPQDTYKNDKNVKNNNREESPPIAPPLNIDPFFNEVLNEERLKRFNIKSENLIKAIKRWRDEHPKTNLSSVLQDFADWATNDKKGQTRTAFIATFGNFLRVRSEGWKKQDNLLGKTNQGYEIPKDRIR